MDPATEEVAGTIAKGNKEDVDKAVDAAENVYFELFSLYFSNITQGKNWTLNTGCYISSFNSIWAFFGDIVICYFRWLNFEKVP